MKKTLTVLALLSMAALPALAQAPVPSGDDSPEGNRIDEAASATASVLATDPQEPLADPIEGAVAPGAEGAFEPLPTALPPCSLIVGTACTPPGSTAWCQWRPGEPELCTCESDGVWHCGNLP